MAGPAPLDAALITVGHGSRDPRSAATVAAVADAVAAARPGVTVRPAFLDLSAPSVDQVVDAVAGAGHTHAVVVPLLLGNAFHARVDLPGLLASARRRHPLLRIDRADVLGPDPRLVHALADRVRAACAPDSPSLAPHERNPHRRLGVVVAAVGASSATANARTRLVARALAEHTGWSTDIGFATTEPGVSAAKARLSARGVDRIVVAHYFLAPGLLTDRITAATPDLTHTAALGAHPALVDLVWDRYDAACGAPRALSA
ncbi:sirohydrochlorin chelatase [Nocardia higoensis]|uniref:Sirohydrochlorin chelatase n=1 Tax=Nocardia higoensis TaxID=228599 RepID=A0ABS0DEU7_9NOCA|nr:sirohydrochlorin chelatase [Nocardia higoensis]MBF6356985.1 sirohydrochlorin chelatase [Nocardia higoensis]